MDTIMVSYSYNILVTDKNKHVRNHIKRELTAEGYNVLEALDYLQTKHYLVYGLQVHLFILDPEIQCNSIAALIRETWNNVPQLPIIIHGFLEHESHLKNDCQVYFVEKQAGSIDQLKKIIKKILTRCTPDRIQV